MYQQPQFSPLQWKQLIIVPLVVFIGVLALFAYFDIDKHLAYFLSRQPGGFPYAGSETYEFWFHRFPKIISGTIFLGILGVAVLSIPLITLLEKLPSRHWQKLLRLYTQLAPVASLRRWLGSIPKTIIITSWLTVIAIVFASEMIGHLKRSSDVYCPIRIGAYGGEENVPLSSVHEPFPTFAPNGGKCWPGGHSITGFIFEACFFGLYSLGMRRAAWISLAVAFAY
jgi:membrane-associated PAP2 superfamily phosphatase